MSRQSVSKEPSEVPPFYTAILIHVGIYIWTYLKYVVHLFKNYEQEQNGYPPLLNTSESIYARQSKCLADCFRFPLCSAPGSEINVIERVSYNNWDTFELTNNHTHCINFASFNYLGLSRTNGECSLSAISALHDYGLSTGNTRQQRGMCSLHRKLETATAAFLGTEDAVAFGMGYLANALGIPAFAESGCLVVSDKENHASMILGTKLTGATVKVFKHNDMGHLESILKEATYYGQPNEKMYVPWRKILILVEGIYNMAGSLTPLPMLIELKKKYKAYLYVDEAHSIGVLGHHGKGVTEYYGISPKDVDVLMGSYSKAFGSMGGYIAGSKEVINYLREHGFAAKYGRALSPVAAGQALAALHFLNTDDGRKKIKTLARNAIYIRRKLQQMGLVVGGYERSPVIPVMVYHFSKLGEIVRTLLRNGVAVVGVGYPAVEMTSCRLRMCISADHERGQLDYVLTQMRRQADRLGLRYSRRVRDTCPVDYNEIQVR